MDALDQLLATLATAIGYLIGLLVLLLLIGALLPRRKPGSLDDLDSVSIQKAVDHG